MPQLITAKLPFKGSVHPCHEDKLCALRRNVIHNTPPNMTIAIHVMQTKLLWTNAAPMVAENSASTSLIDNAALRVTLALDANRMYSGDIHGHQ
jgi:hypothetical protein